MKDVGNLQGSLKNSSRGGLNVVRSFPSRSRTGNGLVSPAGKGWVLISCVHWLWGGGELPCVLGDSEVPPFRNGDTLSLDACYGGGVCCWLWTAAHTELYTLCVWSLGPCQRLPGALLRCWARGPRNVSPASPTPTTSFGPQFAICKCLEDLQGRPEIHVVWVDQTVKDVGWSKNGTWYFLLWFCSEAIFSVVEQTVEVL